MADDLPTVEARAALFDELAVLIERRGIEPFVAAPLLDPLDRFTPYATTYRYPPNTSNVLAEAKEIEELLDLWFRTALRARLSAT
jgi:hypothetical protein